MNKLMQKLNISTDKSFYRDILALAIPLALQSLFMQGVNTIDGIMMGQLGEVMLSAVNIGLEPFNVIGGINRGLSIGTAVLVAQYWGKRDTEAIKKITAISLKSVLLIATVCFVIVEMFPQQILHIFTEDMVVIEAATGYLKIIAITFMLYAFSNNYLLIVRSLQSGKVPFITNVISYSLNIFFDYAFIFGKFGFPQLGIIGVGIGTLLARIVEFAICVIHMLFINKKVIITVKDLFGWDTKLFKDLLTYGIPSLLSETVFTMGMAAYSVVFGHLGTVAMSAKSIAETISKLPQAFVSGVCGASSVLIGKTIGEGRKDKLRAQVNSFCVIIAGVVVVNMLIIWAMRNPVIGLYQITDETVAMAVTMTNIAIFTTLGRGYEALFVTGIQVGSGDTKYIFWYTTIVMWLFVMPAAFLGAFYFKLSAPVVYIILKMDYVIKGVVGFIRTRGTRWIKDVTAD